jgi:transposase-like protein
MDKSKSLTAWKQLLDEQTTSGQNIKTFCERRGINRHTFQYWRRKLNDTEKLSTPGFIAINTSSHSADRLVLQKGKVSLALPFNYPTAQLAALLRELC